MTQYWVVILPLPLVGVAKNVQIWSNWCFHLFIPLYKHSHSKNRWNLGCFSRNPSNNDAILVSVSCFFSIAFSRRRKECHANRVELMFSLVHPFVQTVTLQKSWESWMFFEKPIET